MTPMSLAGKTVVVIGGGSGIGFAVAELARVLRADVVIGSSRQATLDAAVERLPGVSGRRVICAMKTRLPPCSMAWAISTTWPSPQGIGAARCSRPRPDLTLLGRATLSRSGSGALWRQLSTAANRLAGLLHAGARVVMVSSAGHRGADVDLDDPNFTRTPYDPLVAYRRSKTATVLFAVAFDQRHEEHGIRATAVHPGAVLTETTRKMIAAQPSAASAFTWKSVSQGATTPIWAGFVAPANDIGGRYCEDCHVAAVNDDPVASVGVRSYALDPERAQASVAHWESGSARSVGSSPTTRTKGPIDRPLFTPVHDA